MESVWTDPPGRHDVDPKWGKMLGISLLLHALIFSVPFFMPGPPSFRRPGRPVYVVDLVELPGAVRSTPGTGLRTKKTARHPVSKRTSPAKRIRRAKEKPRPVIIARRTIRKKRRKPRKRRLSPSRLIDRAVSKIEKKVRKDEANPVDLAIARITSRIRAAGAGTARRPATGIIIEIYKQEVEDWIKRHWSFAVDLAAPGRQGGLRAVVVVEAARTGKILKSWIKERSNAPLFDQSVLKAVERSDPLPPFPEGYTRRTDEFEITFDLSDLETR